jgi:hypothetical protein
MPGCDVRTLDTLRFELKPCCEKNPESTLDDLSGLNHVLFGLPCTRCRAYYDADLDACPICGCKERVSPTQGSPAVRPAAVRYCPWVRTSTVTEVTHNGDSDGGRSPPVFGADG